VVHACDSADEVPRLIDAQRAIGMKPYLLAAGRTGALAEVNASSGLNQRTASGSLLTAWNEVREWRKLLTDPSLSAFELVHAHNFAAGMAAVRNCPVVVYDIDSFVESRATMERPGEFTWLARSFRVAEQFVIGRAGAIVVHSHCERDGVLERGGLQENLFQLPAPLDPDWVELLRYRKSAARDTGDPAEGVGFFAPDVCLREEDGDALPPDAIQLLEAFALLRAEIQSARLFVQADSGCVQPLFDKARALGITSNVHAISAEDHEHALAEADVIIAVASAQAENTVLTGLLKGRAVLAADAPPARDASPEGRGVLWFRSGDLRDLAHRATFLARNPDLRAALAESGRRHLLETRAPEAVGRQYDVVYRHAFSRRRPGASAGTGMNLQPLVACF
jgi:hypothetical protein